MTDEELLLRIQSRDRDALSALYDRYSRTVYGLLMALLKDTDEAEDATQEVFLRIWNKSETYSSGFTSTKNWILRIAHNRGLNDLRARRVRQGKIASGVETEVLENIPEADSDLHWLRAARSEENAIVAQAVSTLTPEQRVLIELAFLKGFTHSEIAEMTMLPLGTIKTRIRSGLKELRAQLRPLERELNPE